jgi:DNA-binding NarL/FixJ family response regulator
VSMPGLGEISVLIVEDSEIVAQSLARACEVPGMRVVGVVSTAAPALEASLQYRPDVVLMDYRLGADNGVSIAKRLLSAVPTSKIVIVTGAATDEERAEALDAGCMGLVEKSLQVGKGLATLVQRVAAGGPV